MTYRIEEQYNSPNYTPGNAANSVWGLGNRAVKSITIHWWGDPNQHPTYENTINYLCRAGGITSAHVVAEAGRAAWIVNGTDSAWHAGNAWGNTSSIGIECNPRAWESDYQTVAELIRDIRSIYGNIPLVPHRDWQATACPGVYDLAKLDRMARNGSSAPAPIASPVPQSPATPTGTIKKYITAEEAYFRASPWVSPNNIKATLKKGTPTFIVGYVKGVDPFNDGVQDDAWFKDNNGLYVWVNGVGNDITNVPYLGEVLPPKPVVQEALHNRVVTNKVAMVRVAPDSNAAPAPGFPNGLANGAALAIKGFVAGQDPYGTGDNAWYVTKSNYYVWANAAGNNLSGLAKLN